ncbi:signal peptidase I SipW [Pontibacillus litoralis]|nr:signal peptidase I [Pontibacillus litoralis]
MIGLLLIVCLTVFVVSVKASGGEPTLMGYQFKSVLSGSMEPTFQTGSLIIIKQTKDGKGHNRGDVITFVDKNDHIVTHRITEVKQAGKEKVYTTKGDNNDGVDVEPVFSNNVIGEYTGFTIPYVGYIVQYASSNIGSALLLFVPGALLFLHGMLTFRKAVRTFKEEYGSASQT